MTALFVFASLSRLVAAGPLDGLAPGYEVHQESYHGKDVTVVDFSRTLEASHAYRNLGDTRAIPLTALFQNWRGETFIHIGPGGHISIISRGQRYDGRLLFLRSTTLRPSNGLVKSGLLLRLRIDDGTRDEAARELLEAMRRKAGSRTLTCVTGACDTGQAAGAEIPDLTAPESVLRFLLEHPLKWRGHAVRVELITTEPKTVKQYLADLRKVPLTLAQRALGHVCRLALKLF